MLCGIAMDIGLLQIPITSITLSFKSFCSNRTILAIDLRDNLGCTNEIEKPSRSGSKLTVTVELKSTLMNKMRFRVWGYKNGEYLYMLVDGGLTLKYRTYAIKWQDDSLEA